MVSHHIFPIPSNRYTKSPARRSLHRFKLHLRPAHFKSLELSSDDLRPLPPGKTILQVFGDFLKYLFGCAKKSISEAYEADKHGNLVWDSVKDGIDFVLGHPNGWEGLQQAKMREAAVLGGLIPDTPEGRARVHFVSEGEASLQFCMRNNLEMEVRRYSGRNPFIWVKLI